jgi:uncharacterized protein YbjT (DUF2867 family)
MVDVLLIGATGMVGRAVATRLPHGSCTVLARRVPDGVAAGDPGLIVAPVADWPAAIAKAKPAVLVSALGTTIKAAGSQAAFRAVDHDLQLAAAMAAKAAGARHMICVSSVGASAKSGNFYLRTKGEVEAALIALAFDRHDIIRPGLLIGDRQGAARPGEAIAMLAAPFTDALLHGALRKYRSTRANVVARAVAALVAQGGAGIYIHENESLNRLAA